MRFAVVVFVTGYVFVLDVGGFVGVFALISAWGWVCWVWWLVFGCIGTVILVICLFCFAVGLGLVK